MNQKFYNLEVEWDLWSCNYIWGFFWFPLCIWFMQIRIDNVQRYKVAGKTINMVSLIKLQVYLFSFKIYLMKSNKGWSISTGLLYNWGI
jgi:hypothetical protein